MNVKEYNGYTNYETWNVALWLDNSEGDQTRWNERATECLEQAVGDTVFTKEERAQLTIAKELQEEFEGGMNDMLEACKASASVWADLLGGALQEVNWHEIAWNYIQAIKEEHENQN